MAILIPQYKMILTYDIQHPKQAEYSQFVLGRFVPGMQSLNLYIMSVYRTLYGHHPARQAEFVAESWEIVQKAVQHEQFEELETTLKGYTENYTRWIVAYRKGFQIVTNN